MVAFYTSLYDADLTVTLDDIRIVTQTALTAPRTITLPHADATMLGQGAAENDYAYTLEFYDTLGTVNSTNTITFAPRDGDRINGSESPLVIDTTNVYVRVVPLSGKDWFLIQQPFTPSGSGGSDYFATFEEVNSGDSPSINPDVFLTKVTSGGSGGVETVFFDDYIADQAGKPHLIVFETQTDPGDQISIEGSGDILITPFGPLGNAASAVQWPAVFAMNTMLLNAVGDGFLLTWKGSNWTLAEQVGATPTITYDNAFKEVYDGLSAGPSVLTQLEDNTFALVPDATSPFIPHTITASANILTPTVIPPVPRATRIISAGNGGPSYVKLSGVDIAGDGSADDFSLTTKIVRVASFVDPADTIVVSVNDNLRNADGPNTNGSFFTSVVFDSTDDVLSLYWNSNVWIAAPPSTVTTVPPVKIPLIGNVIQFQANNANTTFSVPAGSVILAITFREINNATVTGGVKIGTTSGATDVVAAQAVGANSIGCITDAAVLLKIFSATAAQTLFVQPVTSWNGARVLFQALVADVI